MGRRQGKQVYRGAAAANAVPTRTRGERVAYAVEGGSIVTPEVPYDVICKKKMNKHGELSARRAVMKAKMALKAGITGFGCVIGSHATITYPMSEEEKALMESMEPAAVAGNGAAV